MLRAVPAMIFMAASTSLAFRSFIFSSAISRTLALGHRGDLVAVGLAGALFDAGGLAQKHRGRRRLGDEGEGAVFIDRDLHRDDRVAFLLGLGVEGLAEIHDVDAVLAQRGADRRGGVSLPGGNLQLDECHYFFSH